MLPSLKFLISDIIPEFIIYQRLERNFNFTAAHSMTEAILGLFLFLISVNDYITKQNFPDKKKSQAMEKFQI